MSTWSRFECPTCHEPFEYKPKALVEQRIRDMELQIGGICIVMVECPHCPETLTLDRETGRTTKFDKVGVDPEMGGIFWDMSFTEDGKEEVQKLLEEGDRIAAANPAKAEVIFRKAIAIRKHSPHAWYNLGVCQHRQRQMDEAVKSYRHALQFGPEITQAWNNLGSCLLELNKVDEGEESFDKGIAANPENPKLYLGKANVAVLRGDLVTAKKFLLLALEKDPNYHLARQSLERLELAEQQYLGRRK